MLKRHEIQVLRHVGHTQAEIATFASVSIATVARVEDEEAVTHVDDAKARAARRLGRPAKAEPFRQFIVDELAAEKETELLSLELVRRARLKGYSGGKSALYALIAELRPPVTRPLVRFEGLPGEFCQHDFGHVDVRFLDGTKRRVHFFASRLKYSRWVQVSLVTDETTETVVRSVVEHYAAFGGVPLLGVFDRPKTIVLQWAKDGTVTRWNPAFGEAMLDLGVGVELCWPYSGNQKGSVENLVGWVKGSFFKQRRFLDDEDLRQQLAEWHDEVNTRRPSRATGVIPAVRLAEERPRLRPLKVAPADLALRIPVTVGPTGYVLHDTQRYGMDPDAVGLPGTLYLYRDRVRIVAGRFAVTHARLFERNAKTALPEHQAAMVAAVAGKRAKRYLKREHLLELGPIAFDFITELVHRRPNEWPSHVDQLHAFLLSFGPARLLLAVERAVAAHTIGAEYVAHYLGDPNLDAHLLRLAPQQQELPL